MLRNLAHVSKVRISNSMSWLAHAIRWAEVAGPPGVPQSGGGPRRRRGGRGKRKTSPVRGGTPHSNMAITHMFT